MANEITSKTETLGLSAPEKMNHEHDFSQFDCGEESINEFVKTIRKQVEYRNSVVYVICDIGTKIVRGFYTLSNGSVNRDEPPKNMTRYSTKDIPVTLLGRLGVDKTIQGHGVGADLLRDAVERAIAASQVVASRALLVHALDERVAAFYKGQAGFKESPISPVTLFLSLR